MSSSVGPQDGRDLREVLVVGNPYSGKRGNRKHVEELLEVLARRGLNPKALWRPEEREEELGRADLEAVCRCVVVAGGDGTVRDVLNEMPRVPIAVFPLGNENLFAKEFGFDLDAERLADAIQAGRSRRVDVATAGGATFGVVLSAGFDAEVVHRVAHWRAEKGPLKRVNDLSYVPRALSALVKYPFPAMEIVADGKRYQGYQLFVMNFNRYGMGLNIAPEAKGDDGLLDWLLLTKPGRWKLITSLLRLVLRMRLPESAVLRGVARHLSIHSAVPVPVEVDGDAFGFTPVEVTVRGRAVSVLEMP